MKPLFGAKEGGVFRDERPLLPEYCPSDLLFREEELSAIARCVSGVARGQRPENAFVHGPTGTGKTTAAKLMLEQLSEFTDKAVPVYVNCWESSSRQAILSLIADSLGEAMPRRGIGSDEIFSRVLQSMRYQQKACVVVLDEADRIVDAGAQSLLYDLSRAKENHGVVFSLVLITNSKDFLLSIDERIKSSLRPYPVEFKRYTPSQLKDILSARAKLSLMPQAFDDELIGLCAAFGAKAGGDARVALETLYLASRNAERRGANAITEADVRAAYENSGEWKKEQRSAGTTAGEQRILDLLAGGAELSSGELYAKFRKAGGSESERQVRNYLEGLEARKLILVRDGQATGGRGKTRLIKLA